MHPTQIQKWHKKAGWLCFCMVICLSQVFGQTFAEELKAGQTIKVEWIQQELSKQNSKQSPDRPLFPDELRPGESELRIGLSLKSDGVKGQLIAEVTHINYLALPELKKDIYLSNTEDLLPQPIILDTRFKEPYFNPEWLLLDVLSQQILPISCESATYRVFFDQFVELVEQSIAGSNLLKEQLEWLEKSSFPSSLSASSMAAFFCQLMEEEVPAQESPVHIQSRKQKDAYSVDYLKVDHPAKVCVLKGRIESPATEQLRVQFFREGNWLDYWQDTVIQLDRDGDFEFAFSLDHPRMIGLFHGYQTMRFYFEPGDTIQLLTNANAFYREMQVKGKGAAENEFLLDFYHEMRGDTIFRSFDYDLLEKDHVEYFQNIQAKEARELTFLGQQSPYLRSGFTALMNRNLKLNYATTQWEAAHRFMAEKHIWLEPDLLEHLQKMASLLYRLPRERTFDFDVEDFLRFQYQLIQNVYQSPSFGPQEDLLMAQLLPSKETFIRHAVMQLFRKYAELGQLTESGQWQLTQLMTLTRDTQLLQEMTVFAEGKRSLAPAVGYRVLQAGKVAPFWSFEDKEGVKVGLEDFSGKKLLLHIGWADNLDIAMDDIQSLRQAQTQAPEIVHLLGAGNKDEFTKRVAGRKGLFVFVPLGKMEELKENYFIDNSSNHYFLIGENGKVLANHRDLGTASKLKSTWETMAKLPAKTAWTADQRLQFWQSLGFVALFLLSISGVILWRRRIMARRDLRRRQLLEIELRGIRSQMNPHFLFNAMSSIQNLIRKKEQEKADVYLGQFAGLMRKTLRNTAEEYIPLTDEIETLEQYCSLESLRHVFHYEFQIDESIDAHNTYIPSMILQPIIENAIIHGLAPQTGARMLLVKIGPGEKGLNCTITDNGIGILATQKYMKKKSHKSVGMKLVRQRLELMGLDGEEHLSITDRSNLSPPAQGTYVSLTIPVEK